MSLGEFFLIFTILKMSKKSDETFHKPNSTQTADLKWGSAVDF